MKALMTEHDRPIINLDDHNIVSIYEDALVTKYELPVSPILVFISFFSIFLGVSLDIVVHSEHVYIPNFQLVRPF